MFHIIAQVVRNVSKKDFQEFHEGIHIVGAELTHKLSR